LKDEREGRRRRREEEEGRVLEFVGMYCD